MRRPKRRVVVRKIEPVSRSAGLVSYGLYEYEVKLILRGNLGTGALRVQRGDAVEPPREARFRVGRQSSAHQLLLGSVALLGEAE